MTVRKCGTCKHYEPAPIWRKGWCRNPLLYSPQQSHLVGEDDLDCDRGMGNYWEPINQDDADISSTRNVGYATNTQSEDQLRSTHNDDPRGRSDFLFDDPQPERRGGDVSQYGGPGRPTGSGGYGDGGGFGGGDDDRHTQPFGDPDDRDPYDSEQSPFGYQPEERYWTDYLRIALPVVGVILMLALVWFWLAYMLGNNDDENDVAMNDDDVSGPVIPSETATPGDDETDDSPITVMTPGTDENGEDTDAETPDAPTVIGPGATVVVSGTGEDGLNVRSSASTDGDVVTSVADGTALTITGESQQSDGYTWWPIETNGTTGFVVEDFIQLSE